MPTKKGTEAKISIAKTPWKNFESSPVDTWAAMSPIVIPAMYSKKES
ncbi:Uncharacterised protein [Streptococcus pneumoniae]|nr:hypothetical protein B4120_3537 [Bacillus cereus]CJD59777.1 Uncharacterised protein [Streptococcus pneumoniae]